MQRFISAQNNRMWVGSMALVKLGKPHRSYLSEEENKLAQYNIGVDTGFRVMQIPAVSGHFRAAL